MLPFPFEYVIENVETKVKAKGEEEAETMSKKKVELEDIKLCEAVREAKNKIDMVDESKS